MILKTSNCLAGKRHAMLNGKLDEDSGHGEMSDTNSEIDTIMSSVSHSSNNTRVSHEPLTRSNSDVAAVLSRRGRVLKDKRSRSIDQARTLVG